MPMRRMSSLADDAVHLGPTPATESYLSIERLLAAAKESGAEAIHPGYGFLSERAEFARAVVDAGLVFIGPTADVMDAMGRKDRARAIAERAGVPVTPQFDPQAGDVPADAYPVLVKAAAGGGGKGMRIVHDPSELTAAIEAARREAASAFGDDTMLVEKYVEGGRHVEVQVFGDNAGHVVHLFERDCSAQRRHQKVVEEAPAFGLTDQLRQTLHDSSVALCREVGYTGAGTVEFLVAGGEAYFLEMNTRLQVEHPVTEEITGLDLVQWQFAVAAGDDLPLTQDQITATGHAIEVRVYAEDPYAGFLPQAGSRAGCGVAHRRPGRDRSRTRSGGLDGVRPDARQDHRDRRGSHRRDRAHGGGARRHRHLRRHHQRRLRTPPRREPRVRGRRDPHGLARQRRLGRPADAAVRARGRRPSGSRAVGADHDVRRNLADVGQRRLAVGR